MRILSLLFVAACVMALTGNSVAQTLGQRSSHGVMGYLDERGGFHPLPAVVDENGEPQATSTYNGKFVFNFTITVDATIASSAKIGCEANAQVVDTGSGNVFEEEAGALATRSGSTATCTVNIPYSWSLASGSTDKVLLSVSITAPVEEAASAEFPNRLSIQPLGSISVPSKGSTTTETVTATF